MILDWSEWDFKDTQTVKLGFLDSALTWEDLFNPVFHRLRICQVSNWRSLKFYHKWKRFLRINQQSLVFSHSFYHNAQTQNIPSWFVKKACQAAMTSQCFIRTLSISQRQELLNCSNFWTVNFKTLKHKRMGKSVNQFIQYSVTVPWMSRWSKSESCSQPPVLLWFPWSAVSSGSWSDWLAVKWPRPTDRTRLRLGCLLWSRNLH